MEHKLKINNFSDTLFLVALEVELPKLELSTLNIHYTGVGKVNAALQSHFEKTGATMAKEWASRAGSRGQAVLSAYK
mgnify:CR=1 FL=1